MKKNIIAFAAFVLMAIVVMFMVSINSAHAWGNQSWFDTTYSFEYVQIAMPDGSYVDGEVQSWQDYENSDVVQVKVDDKVYLTHYMNVVLISE